MADITLASNFAPAIGIRRPALLDALVHRAEVLRRRARRDRYLAIMGRSRRHYPWFDALFTGMSGRS